MFNIAISIICLILLIMYIYKIRKEIFIGPNVHPSERVKPIIICNDKGVSINGKNIFWKEIDFIHFSNNYNGTKLAYYRLYPWIKLFKLCGAKQTNDFENKLNQKVKSMEGGTLLIFTFNKRTPYIINLQLMSVEQAKEVIDAFNKYNNRIDLWKNKLQKTIWS